MKKRIGATFEKKVLTISIYRVKILIFKKKEKGEKRVKTNQFFINGVREREKVSKGAIISEHLINFHLVHNYRCEKNRLEIETR